MGCTSVRLNAMIAELVAMYGRLWKDGRRQQGSLTWTHSRIRTALAARCTQSQYNLAGTGNTVGWHGKSFASLLWHFAMPRSVHGAASRQNAAGDDKQHLSCENILDTFGCLCICEKILDTSGYLCTWLERVWGHHQPPLTVAPVLTPELA